MNQWTSIPIDLPKNMVPQFCRICFGIIWNTSALETHLQFHEGIKKDMSTAKWCDPGNHAFKAGSPGSQSATITVTNDEGQGEIQQMDACPDHAFRPTSTPALTTEGNDLR